MYIRRPRGRLTTAKTDPCPWLLTLEDTKYIFGVRKTLSWVLGLDGSGRGVCHLGPSPVLGGGLFSVLCRALAEPQRTPSAPQRGPAPGQREAGQARLSGRLPGGLLPAVVCTDHRQDTSKSASAVSSTALPPLSCPVGCSCSREMTLGDTVAPRRGWADGLITPAPALAERAGGVVSHAEADRGRTKGTPAPAALQNPSHRHPLCAFFPLSAKPGSGRR